MQQTAANQYGQWSIGHTSTNTHTARKVQECVLMDKRSTKWSICRAKVESHHKSPRGTLSACWQANKKAGRWLTNWKSILVYPGYFTASISMLFIIGAMERSNWRFVWRNYSIFLLGPCKAVHLMAWYSFLQLWYNTIYSIVLTMHYDSLKWHLYDFVHSHLHLQNNSHLWYGSLNSWLSISRYAMFAIDSIYDMIRSILILFTPVLMWNGLVPLQLISFEIEPFAPFIV